MGIRQDCSHRVHQSQMMRRRGGLNHEWTQMDTNGIAIQNEAAGRILSALIVLDRRLNIVLCLIRVHSCPFVVNTLQCTLS